MEQIDVDDDVFAVIKENAEPFKDPPDTPNAVLRRLLLSNEAPSTSGATAPSRATKAGKIVPPPRKRAPLYTLLPEDLYWDPILEAIEGRGGEARADEVIEVVGEKLKDDLKPDDYDKLRSGKVRWHNRTQFARLRMKEAGLLRDDSKRGIWAISDAGRERLEEKRDSENGKEN